MAGSRGGIEGRSWWGLESTSWRGRKVAIMAENVVAALFPAAGLAPILSNPGFPTRKTGALKYRAFEWAMCGENQRM